MRRTTIAICLPAVLISSAALAQSYDETTTTTTKRASEVTREGYLRDEVVGIKPQAGVLMFKDFADNTDSRLAAGLTVDVNIMSAISKDMGNWYLGPSTGIIYSHLGPQGSNFVGTGTGNSLNEGPSVFFIPLNAKLGYNITPKFRVAAHGGTNLTYRSQANSLALGSSSVGTGSDWSFFPNVGGDIEWAMSNGTALMLRPDWTITPGNDLFAGTLALNIMVG